MFAPCFVSSFASHCGGFSSACATSGHPSGPPIYSKLFLFLDDCVDGGDYLSVTDICITKQIRSVSHWDFSQTAKTSIVTRVQMRRNLEIVIEDTLCPPVDVDGGLSHNVLDNHSKNTDKDEILSGASIDQGTELTHTFHLSCGHVFLQGNFTIFCK